MIKCVTFELNEVISMDVVLINSSNNETEKLTIDSQMKRVIDMPPLGICYLATALELKGYSVQVIDMGVLSDEEAREKMNSLIECPPKCIGISSSTLSYNNATKIAQYIKHNLGDEFPIIMGGYHVTFEFEDTLKNGFADVVIRGEGEEAIVKVVDIITKYSFRESHKVLYDIEGIAFLDEGRVCVTPPQILRINDLDRIPIPNRDYLDLSAYKNTGTVISSRGCVAKCQFCAAGAFGAIRSRSPENVAQEVELLHNHGINTVYFTDNTFATNKKRAIKIFEILKQKHINVNFFIEARVTEVDEEYADLLKSFGVKSIQFGVETGNSEVMKSIHKNITLERVKKTVEMCCSKGIYVACSFVIGHPADTEDTVKDTIKFATKLRRLGADPAFSIMTPYPGTEAFNKRDELGVEIVDWNYSHWDLNRAVARTKNLTVRQINNLHSEAMLTLKAI